MLSRGIADRIIKNIQKTIEYHINIMDSNGYIIASTDSSRIGSFHEGAGIVIDTKESVEILEDNPRKKVKQGINLPIEINEEIIGVIGLTGKIEEVRKYGLIIKEMTQILALNTLYIENNLLEIERENTIVEYLISNQDFGNFTDLEEMKVKSIIENAFRVIIFKFKDENGIDNSVYNRIYYYNILKEYFANCDCLIGVSNHYIHVILPKVVEETSLKKIVSKYELKNFRLGIGHLVDYLSDIRESFKIARYIVESDLEIHHFNEIEDQYIMATVNHTAAKLLINKLFSKIDKAEMKEMAQLIEIYIECNGSILEISKKLYIHKNTVQYRLDKVYKLTGYNPRKLEDIMILHLGIQLYKKNNSR